MAEVRECYGLPMVSVDPGKTDGVAISAKPVHGKEERGNPGKKQWGIPEGHYAIDGRDGRDTDFYHVDVPTEGKWVGWTFVKMVVGGKDDIRIRDWDKIWAILGTIKQDPQEAMLRYGRELGQCGKCHIHLTKYASRHLGIGPDCAEQIGMGDLWRETQRAWDASQKAAV